MELEEREKLQEELRKTLIQRNALITFSEYQEAVEGIYYNSEDERLQNDIQAPDWFYLFQSRALKLIKKKIAQAHLIPRNRMDYLDLKEQMWVEEGTNIMHTEAENYKQLFTEGLSYQIQFMHEEEITFNNGWLNATNSLNIGGYSQSMTPDKIVNKLFKDLCPASYDAFDTMGWTYACLNHRLWAEDFYKGEK